MGKGIPHRSGCDVTGCTERHYARGFCKVHFERWKRNGDPLLVKKVHNHASLQERLDFVGWTERLVRPDLGPCWEFDGKTDRHGYGRLHDGQIAAFAHRMALAVKLGRPIADGMDSCHRCDNPPCIRGEHLIEGDHDANLGDAARRGRTQHGERHYRAKLTDADAAAIRSAYTGAYGQKSALARQYGVTSDTIRVLLRNETWRFAATNRDCGHVAPVRHCWGACDVLSGLGVPGGGAGVRAEGRTVPDARRSRARG